MAKDKQEQVIANGNSELLKVEKSLTEIDPQLFDGISPEKKRRIVKSVGVTIHKIHSGPLPSPELLEGYSQLIPDGANRIMIMAEKQQAHRFGLEKEAVSRQLFQSQLGQIFAFLIGLAAIGGSTYCIAIGQPWGGGILGLGGITGLVTAFIKGKDHQAKDLEDKRTGKSKNA